MLQFYLNNNISRRVVKDDESFNFLFMAIGFALKNK